MSSCLVVVPGPDGASSSDGRVSAPVFKISWVLTGVVAWALATEAGVTFVVTVVSWVKNTIRSVVVSH